jgi:ribosomal protein S18 acetylase RimI-like enzyme
MPARALAEAGSSRKIFRMGSAQGFRVRQAIPDDAAGIGRVYHDAWQDSYPGILSLAMLGAMKPNGQTARWKQAIMSPLPEMVLAAECGSLGIVGMTHLGLSRDKEIGFDGEIYSLYVDPAFYGLGAGRALLHYAFTALTVQGMSSCVVWAHAHAQSRFFYEAMGGRLVAERATLIMGEQVPEAAYGWKTLVLAEKSPAR